MSSVKAWMADTNRLALVATDGAAIVGILTGSLTEPNDYRPVRVATLNSLYVNPAWHLALSEGPDLAVKAQAPSARLRRAPASASYPWPTGQRLTGPEALMICWKVVGGIVVEHLPPDLGKMARMLRV